MPTYATEAEFLAALAYPRHEVGSDAGPSVVTCELRLRGLALPDPVDIRNVTFEKYADFSEWRCGSSLRLEGCTFENGLRLADTRVEGLCSLARTTFDAPAGGSLDFSRLHVGSLLDCSGVRATAGLDLKGLRTGSDVLFTAAVIDLTAADHVVAVNLSGADVGGSVNFTYGTEVTGRIELGAKVARTVYFGAKVVKDVADVAVDMNAADVGESVIFRDAEATGRIELQAKVGGTVDFNGVTVTALDTVRAVDMFTADVGGSVYFRGGTRLTGWIDMTSATVGGNVHFVGTAVVAAPDRDAVILQNAEVRGEVSLHGGTRVRGNLNLKLAKLRSGLYATTDRTAITFRPPGDPKSGRDLLVGGDWDASFAEVDGPMLLHGVSLCGRFVARHLTVRGDLDVCGGVVGVPSRGAAADLDEYFAPAGRWRDPLPPTWFPFEFDRPVFPEPLVPTPEERVRLRAVDLELAEVHGRLWVKQSRLLGTVHLEDATVTGAADFDGSEVHRDLVLRSAEVRGQVFADGHKGSPAYPHVRGDIDLAFATVQQVEVKFDRDAAEGTPRCLDLTGATVDTLRLAGPVKAEHPPFFVTDGLRFQTLDCTALDVDVSDKPPCVSPNDRWRYSLWLGVVTLALVLAARQGSGLLWWVAGYALLTTGTATYRWWRVGKRDQNDPRLRLLNHLGQTYPFNQGYYVQVERKLREAGNDADADEVFHMRRRRERLGPQQYAALPKRMKTGGGLEERWSRGGFAYQRWLWAVDFFTGFGVRPLRLVHVYVVLALLNTAVFLDPQSVERPVAYVQHRTDSPLWGETNPRPSDKDVPGWKPANPWPADGGMPDVRGEDRWGTGHAAFVALRVQVPVLTLVAENDWSPATRPMWVLGSYADYASVMMVVNLVLIPLIVAGLTGHLKKNP